MFEIFFFFVVLCECLFGLYFCSEIVGFMFDFLKGEGFCEDYIFLVV